MNRRSKFFTNSGKLLFWAGVGVAAAATLAAIAAAVFFSGGGAAAIALPIIGVVFKGAAFGALCGGTLWGITKLYQRLFKKPSSGYPPGRGPSRNYRPSNNSRSGYRQQSRWKFWKKRDTPYPSRQSSFSDPEKNYYRDHHDNRSIISDSSFEDEKRSRLRKPPKAQTGIDYQISGIDHKYAYFIKPGVDSREYRIPLKKLDVKHDHLSDMMEDGDVVHLSKERRGNYNVNLGSARSPSPNPSRSRSRG